ncbi:hypothetical protein AC578_863 [Pseudocercospora eumusae]|uniref:Uncharacterized protein n=1 Tax=Pseudocercospora eumusae TaxID=321146 RepID=A0A139H430_9PEZI|nr:hypothetical protein AC578_863 [Pseudocercospora eumusae]
MQHAALEYAPAGFHATHQSQQQQQPHQTSAAAQAHIAQLPPSSQDSQVHTDEAQPNKRRKLNPQSTRKTIIDRVLTRADDTHRKSNGWPAVPPPDMDLPQFVNPRELMLRPVTPRPEFNWDNNFLFQSTVFEPDELVPIRPVGRPLGSRKQPPPSTSPSSLQAVRHVGTPSAAIAPKVEAPSTAPTPPRQQQYALPEVPSFDQSAALMQKRRDSGAHVHLGGSNDIEAERASPTTSPYPRHRTMSLTSDTGSIYSDASARSNSPAPLPSSTAASSPPKPLPTPKKANPPTPNQPARMMKKKKKKKGNGKYIQPSRQTTNLPHSPPPNVQFIPGTRPIPPEISSLVQRLKAATRKENFPQRTSLRRFEEFDSRYGYLKRSSILWKVWFGDTRLFTEKWWRFFAMTGKGQELGRGDEDDDEIVGADGGDGAAEREREADLL